MKITRRQLRKLLIEITKMRIPIATEFLDTIIPQYIDDLITWGCIGARTVEQLDECLDSQNNLIFSSEELKEIDKYAKEEKINLWAKSSKD